MNKHIIIKIFLFSLLVILISVSVIYAATTIGSNISTSGNLDVSGAVVFSTASSTGTVKFSQINSDTGSVNFGDDNLYTTGNIGIGTSSPYAKLSVVGEIVGSYFTATSTTDTSIFSGGVNINAGGLIYNRSTGNVGIGTENPNQELQVHSASGASIWITAGGSNQSDAGNLRFAESEDGATNYLEFQYDGEENQLDLNSSNGFDVMTWERGGNVGIGTTTPSNILTVNSGATATTTVEFGDQYSSSSKVCHNTKNTAGDNISFYFVGTTMVVENNRCN